MKKIQNLFLVALLAACSTLSVRAMEEIKQWTEREEAKTELSLFNYEKCEKFYRRALKNKDYMRQALDDLQEAVENRLDPFAAFHFARGILYQNAAKVNKKDTDLALKYLIVSIFRTMLDIKVCELVYFKKASYANKLTLLFRRLAELYSDDKVKSLAEYRTYQKALSDVKELLVKVNVHDYAPSFWIASVESTRFWYTFYFYNPTGMLAREINSNKSDSDLQKKDIKKKVSVGSLLIRVLSEIKSWEELFKLATDDLLTIQDPSFDPMKIESFGLSSQGIVCHNDHEYSDEDEDFDEREEFDQEGGRNAITPMEEDITDSKDAGELHLHEDVIEETLNEDTVPGSVKPLKEGSDTNPPVSLPPVRVDGCYGDSAPNSTTAEDLPPVSFAAPEPVVNTNDEKDAHVAVDVATTSDSGDSSNVQTAEKHTGGVPVLTSATIAFAQASGGDDDVIEELTSEIDNLHVADESGDTGLINTTPESAVQTVPSRANRELRKSGTTLGSPKNPRPAKKVGGIRRSGSGHKTKRKAKKKDKKKD